MSRHVCTDLRCGTVSCVVCGELCGIVAGCHQEVVCVRPCVGHIPIPTCRDPDEPWNRSGVNALQIDHLTRRLFTAGRDSIIRTWDISDNKEVDTHTSHSRC